jgi:hypothetical protein
MCNGKADCGCCCEGREGGGCEGEAAFPSNPATALNHHFGMLLGVEDLRAEQAFHLGQKSIASAARFMARAWCGA